MINYIQKIAYSHKVYDNGGQLRMAYLGTQFSIHIV